MFNIEEKINPCDSCIHKYVCCFTKIVAEDISSISRATIERPRRLKISYHCEDYISQEKPTLK